MRKISMRIAAMATVTLVLFGLGAAPAAAQSIDTLVDRALYNGQIRVQQNKITFCLEHSSPMSDLDKAIATEIADTQLMHVDFYDVDLGTVQNGNDDDLQRQLFLALIDHCDALMGVSLDWSPLPEWLTISRSYYSAPYVLAVLDKTYSRLGDIPAGSKIGSNLFTAADENFVLLLNTMPADKGWKRIPYDSVPTMLDALRKHDIEGAIVYGPLLGKVGSDPNLKDITIASTSPLRVDPQQLGILFLSKNTFIRSAIDQAIAAMEQDGTLKSLEQDYASAPGQ